MAKKETALPARRPKAGQPANAIEIVTKKVRDGDLAEINDYFMRGNSWVVDLSGDLFSHYVSVVGNLTGGIVEANEPTFRFVRSMVKAGFPKSAFDRIKSAIATTTEQLSRITEIPARTMARRERFKPDESERLLRVASAFQKSLELFEDLDKARKWFATPRSALAGLAPIECCDTEAGSKEVENLLGRIDEGVYS